MVTGQLFLRIPPLVADPGQTRGGILIIKSEQDSAVFVMTFNDVFSLIMLLKMVLQRRRRKNLQSMNERHHFRCFQRESMTKIHQNR